MKAVIYKYPLQLADEQEVPLPRASIPLSVGEQGGRLVLWAVVDADAEIVPQTILVRGTGQPWTGREGEFIGTVVMDGPDSGLVWHVFRANVNTADLPKPVVPEEAWW